MRAAYDALDDKTRSEIADLVTEHSLMYSRGILGFGEFTPEEQKTFAPVRQRLVRSPSGERPQVAVPCLARRTIVGWPMPEARAFLREPHRARDATPIRPRPSLAPARSGDVDNRATMHRARRYDHTQVRDMRRTTIAGNAPTADQVRAA